MKCITITIDRKHKAVACQSEVTPVTFDGIEIYLFGDFYTAEALPATEKYISQCMMK